jgi:hypothetical protein
MRQSFLGVCCFAFGAALAPGFVAAAAGPVPAADNAPTAVVDLFEAQRAGQIEVKLIPKDAAEGTVVITNKSQQPLSIKLPAAFAGVPVLGQRGARGGVNGTIANGATGGGNQGIGGGFGGRGGIPGGGGGIGGPGGIFNVAPEQVGKLKVVSVCLEHGKKDPSPQVAYDLVPLESFAKDPKVIELVKMLGRGEVDQRAAQAAAWHFGNRLSWQELAEKIGAKHINGTTELYFSSAELDRARQVATEADRRALSEPPKL